jgi:diacylglycerol kinase (ATP)
MISRTVEILKRDGHNMTVISTAGPGTAGRIAREQIEQGADLVLAAGGDGTFNEVAEGMTHSCSTLGILPAGTANVLATEMKLGSGPEGAALRLEQWRPRRISLGHLTCDGGRVSRHFLLMAGAGLDAHVVTRVNPWLKARAGKFAYWTAGWSLLGRRLPEFQADIDGRRSKCSFALISKVRNYGGDFEIARGASLLEDCFEAVLFEGSSSLRYVKYFAGMALKCLPQMEGVTVLRARRAVLSSPENLPIYIQVDGELAGQLPAEIEIVPDALTLLAPPEYRR